MSYVSRGITIFNAFILGILMLGLYGQLKTLSSMIFHDHVFLSALLIGASFPFLISGVFFGAIGANTEKLVSPHPTLAHLHWHSHCVV